MDWYKFTKENYGWVDNSAAVQAREGNIIVQSFRNSNDEIKDLHVYRTMNKTFCWVDYSKDFYYIDTGPFRGGRKGHEAGNKHHRIVKNGYHITDHQTREEVIAALGKRYAYDKFARYFHKPYKQWNPPEQREGKNILLCQDSHVPVIRGFGRTKWTSEQWTNHISNRIKKLYPEANIIIRKKPTPRERRTEEWRLQDQIDRDNIKVVVTFSSFVGLHSLLEGVPAIMLGPSEISCLSSNSLRDINKPFYPDPKKFKEHMLYLTCNQWSHGELQNGTAWEDLCKLQADKKWDPNTCFSCFWPHKHQISWKYKNN